jgi:uncharacterized glyoxalase superfamily protein PhnB
MERSIHFYRDGLGFITDERGNSPRVVFFNTAGTKLELYPLEALAQDINGSQPPKAAEGFSGVTLAYNAKNEAEVHEIMDLAKRAGATIVKAPQKVFWGGYSGYFADPDGYYWEIAYNPFWSFDEQGLLKF